MTKKKKNRSKPVILKVPKGWSVRQTLVAYLKKKYTGQS